MIEGVQKRFSVDESGVVHLNAAANSNALLSIEDCLPKNMVRNPEYLKNDKYISAALLPNILRLCLRTAIFTSHSRTNTYSVYSDGTYRQLTLQTASVAEMHPLWAELFVEVQTVTKVPGLSETVNAAVLDIASNIRNMWNTNIFDHSTYILPRKICVRAGERIQGACIG